MQLPETPLEVEYCLVFWKILCISS